MNITDNDKLDSSLVLDVFEEVFGDVRDKGYPQIQMNCPMCAAENGGEVDGKYNLEVNLKYHKFRCWKCENENNMKGKLSYLINRFFNKSQKDRVGLSLKGISLEPLDIDSDVIFPKEAKTIPFDSNNRFYKYLLNRGLNYDFVKKYNIYYCDEGKYSNRVLIPSLDVNGNIDYFISRLIYDKGIKYLNPKSGKERMIFNERMINWNFPVTLVEGVFDHMVTYNSIPILGKKVSDKLLNSIHKNCTSDVYIVLDNDAIEQAEEIYNQINVGIMFGRVKIIEMGDKDPSKIFETEGYKGISKIYKNI